MACPYHVGFPYEPASMAKVDDIPLPYNVGKIYRPQLHALYAIWICLLVDCERR